MLYWQTTLARCPVSKALWQASGFVGAAGPRRCLRALREDGRAGFDQASVGATGNTSVPLCTGGVCGGESG